MVHSIRGFLVSVFIATTCYSQYQCTINNISGAVYTKILNQSYKPECPVRCSDLRYVIVSYWDYNGQEQLGELIVHHLVADDICAIFSELYDARFPIASMRLIDDFNADDESSMQANNTSAFCYRSNVTTPTKPSMHSYGLAIDINPLVNPYVRGDIVLPKTAGIYTDRTRQHQGSIMVGDVCCQAFTSRGWQWGGSWPDRQDYQHFEKHIEHIA